MSGVQFYLRLLDTNESFRWSDGSHDVNMNDGPVLAVVNTDGDVICRIAAFTAAGLELYQIPQDIAGSLPLTVDGDRRLVVITTRVVNPGRLF